MKDMAFWLIAAVIYLAILFSLVRPSSKGPVLVEQILGTLTDLVRGSTGFTYNKNTNKWVAPSSGSGSGNGSATLA